MTLITDGVSDITNQSWRVSSDFRSARRVTLLENVKYVFILGWLDEDFDLLQAQLEINGLYLSIYKSVAYHLTVRQKSIVQDILTFG